VNQHTNHFSIHPNRFNSFNNRLQDHHQSPISEAFRAIIQGASKAVPLLCAASSTGSTAVQRQFQGSSMA
jgi:hypothetical protein